MPGVPDQQVRAARPLAQRVRIVGGRGDHPVAPRLRRVPHAQVDDLLQGAVIAHRRNVASSWLVSTEMANTRNALSPRPSTAARSMSGSPCTVTMLTPRRAAACDAAAHRLADVVHLVVEEHPLAGAEQFVDQPVHAALEKQPHARPCRTRRHPPAAATSARACSSSGTSSATMSRSCRLGPPWAGWVTVSAELTPSRGTAHARSACGGSRSFPRRSRTAWRRAAAARSGSR